jgi:hypothetical protein
VFKWQNTLVSKLPKVLQALRQKFFVMVDMAQQASP